MNKLFDHMFKLISRNPVNAEALISRANSVLSDKSQLAKERVSNALQKLNSITGYSEIDRLKQKVIQSELQYSEHRKQLWDARQQYEKTLQQRSQCQREINNLLQRKHTWSSNDVKKFTELYSQEHSLERTELETRRLFEQTEKQLEESHSNMLDSIRLRYQEEQVWSDNIRSLSSYGTIALMLVNLGMFIGVHSYMEPRRRQNLVENIDTRFSGHVQDLERKFSQEFTSLNTLILGHERILNDIKQVSAQREVPLPTEPTPVLPPAQVLIFDNDNSFETYLKPALYFIGGTAVGIASILLTLKSS